MVQFSVGSGLFSSEELTGVFSCAALGDQSVRRLDRISGTEKACGPCASYSVVLVRPNERTSNRSPPSRSDMASLQYVSDDVLSGGSFWCRFYRSLHNHKCA